MPEVPPVDVQQVLDVVGTVARYGPYFLGALVLGAAMTIGLAIRIDLRRLEADRLGRETERLRRPFRREGRPAPRPKRSGDRAAAVSEPSRADLQKGA